MDRARDIDFVLKRAVWIVLLVVGGGCATQTLSEDRGELFQQAVDASSRGRHVFAARAAHRYFRSATSDDPRYDRSLRILARSAEELGLTYAASLWYLDIARARRNLDLVDDAVAGLQRIVEGGPHDRETLIDGFLATAEITGLPPEQRGFVSYHRGLNSLRRGRTEWAKDAFSTIPEGSPYAERADFAWAVRRVAEYDLEAAREQLKGLLERDLSAELELKVRRTLGRLAFERDDFERALGHYRTIQDRAPERPRLLLEMAWSHYYAGNYRRALGLLVALDAPIYSELIAPRRFLLEALTLRELCQYGPARKAAVRLQREHGEALDDLHSGVSLADSTVLRRAAALRSGGREVAAFRDRIERERRRLKELSERFGPALTRRLESIYRRGVREARRREREELRDDMKALAQELLEAEEGVRLILHELGVSLLRGQRQSTTGRYHPPVETPAVSDRVYYRFNGEFWTDELDDLVVQIEDRCIRE
ncbi:MAG: tetratricopeptide repeat protein [Bradymonadaceae bacterium]